MNCMAAVKKLVTDEAKNGLPSVWQRVVRIALAIKLLALSLQDFLYPRWGLCFIRFACVPSSQTTEESWLKPLVKMDMVLLCQGSSSTGVAGTAGWLSTICLPDYLRLYVCLVTVFSRLQEKHRCRQGDLLWVGCKCCEHEQRPRCHPASSALCPGQWSAELQVL